METRKRELILKYLNDGDALDEIAQQLGYSSGAGLTTTIQDMMYERYDKIYQERQGNIDQNVLNEIGETFRKNSDYVSKYIVKGLYKELKKELKDEATIKKIIINQVQPMNISATDVESYL